MATVRALHRYNQDVETVFKTFVDANFLLAKYQALGHRHGQVVENGVRGGLHVVKTQREVPANVPSALKQFIGAWNKVVQTEKWSGEAGRPRRCQITIETPGIPVTIAGSLTLRPEGTGCVNEVQLEVTSSIPLLGRALTSFVAGDTEKSVAAEYIYIKGQLDHA